MSLLRHSFLAALAVAAIAAAAPAYADMEKYKADLTGSGEVPPTSSKGTGSIEATYDTATKTLTWRPKLTAPMASTSHRRSLRASTNSRP